MFKPLKTRVLLLILAMLALFPGNSPAAWYLAGYFLPQQNAYGAKNESAIPPAAYSIFNTNFYGFFQVIARADRGELRSYHRLQGQPVLRRTDATMRFDDVVFSCADGRSSVSYQAVLELNFQSSVVNTPGYTPGYVAFAVGQHGGGWGTWRTDNGGSGRFTGIPAGPSFAGTVSGPLLTASTGIPQTVGLSVTSQPSSRYGQATGDATGSFPTDGSPVFLLPAGCTCNSAEANIVNNVWLGTQLPPPTIAVFGTISSECSGTLSGVEVTLIDGNGVPFVTTTDANGYYEFATVGSSTTATGSIQIATPAGHEAVDPATIALDLDIAHDATLICSAITVDGSIASDCDGALAGVEVTLVDGDGVSQTATTDANGAYTFADIGYSANPGAVSFAAPAGYTAPNGTSSAIDLTTSATQDFTLECVYVGVSGVVSSDCGGALETAEVTLVDGDGVSQTASTDATGAYAFSAIRYSANLGTVSLTVPVGYTATNGNSATVDLSADSVQDFAVECILVDLIGTVRSSCGGALQGVTVDLLDASGGFHTTTSDAEGDYAFTDLPFSDQVDAAEVSISIPLGYEAEAPGVAGAAVTLDQDRMQDFDLACLDPTGDPRSMGYWKHQASVHLKNKGSAQESYADTAINFPMAIFSHFHENSLNGIQVPGVTYIDSGSGHTPIDLQTIQNTLTVNKGGTMADRARQQYLAFLLNVASGKLLTQTIVSADGATASQALQQVAFDIMDGDPSNDESAKDIGDIINNAGIVPAGMIDLNIDSIAYKDQPLPGSFELRQNHPNPFNPRTTIELALAKASDWNVAIFDVAGRLVRQYEGSAAAGVVRVDWDGTDLRGRAVGSGQYFYRAQASGFDATRKMTLVQ